MIAQLQLVLILLTSVVTSRDHDDAVCHTVCIKVSKCINKVHEDSDLTCKTDYAFNVIKCTIVVCGRGDSETLGGSRTLSSDDDMDNKRIYITSLIKEENLSTIYKSNNLPNLFLDSTINDSIISLKKRKKRSLTIMCIKYANGGDAGGVAIGNVATGGAAGGAAAGGADAGGADAGAGGSWKGGGWHFGASVGGNVDVGVGLNWGKDGIHAGFKGGAGGSASIDKGYNSYDFGINGYGSNGYGSNANSSGGAPPYGGFGGYFGAPPFGYPNYYG